jgi:glycosyltransferase involved in cell wall biosynthesis
MKRDRISILHAVTDSRSTILMRGQMAYLKENGFDTALLSSPGEELDRISSEEGHAAFEVPMRREIAPLHDLKSLFDIWKLLRRIKPVICNSGTPKAGLLVGIAAWLTRVPCRVYTLRGLRLETESGLKRSILAVTEKISCGCAHRVICVSPSLLEQVVAKGLVPRRKTALLGAGSSNGVDPLRFARTPEKLTLAAEMRHKLGIRSNQPVIGFAGRFTNDKGLPELIAAFQQVRKAVPETALLLVGHYEEGDPVPQATRDAIKSEPGIYCVEFTPQIELYYLVMSIFVLPTYREGFPNTILEAQAAGLPVVTTTATGAVDAIHDGITGLLTPVGDSHKLAEAILALLADRKKMQRMGGAGRERVLREFRNEIIWQALSSLYTDMLQKRGYLSPADSRVEAVRCVHTQ